MTQPSGDSDHSTPDPIEDVREAASEVIGSLKRLIEATEKVVADPASFDQVVSGGRSIIDAFTSGFVGGPDEAPDPRGPLSDPPG